MDVDKTITNRPPLDWSAFKLPAGWKQTGADEYHGPCPVTGAGKDRSWLQPQRGGIGCRECGDGSGKLTDGPVFRAHAQALGILPEVDLGASGAAAWPSWTWRTTDGRERRQFRIPDGRKVWHKKDAPPDGWPKPADLMFLPAGDVPRGAPVVYVCEGATDALAVHGLGLPAVGRTNARPSPASLARLDKGAVYRVWPDHDPKDAAGYRQAVTWCNAAKRAGLTVDVIDPLILRPDAPAGYDARDWCGELPDGTDAAGAAAILEPAVVAVEAIRERTGAAPVPGAPVPGAAAPGPVLPAGLAFVPSGLIRPCESERDLADLITEHAAGRLAYVHEERAWFAWTAGAGWRPVTTETLRGAVAAIGRANYGSVNRDGELSMTPRQGGRAATAGGVIQILAGLVETHAADWDADPVRVALPSGEILNLATGERLPPRREDLIRRRLGAMPATDSECERSRFRAVLLHCVPDPAAREFLQRRLGAALQDAQGLDHLIALHGPGGSGKGSILKAIRAVFGSYESGVPTSEIVTGGRRGHPAWKARYAGVRLLTIDDFPVDRDLDPNVIKELIGGRLNGVQHMGAAPFDLDLNAPIITASNAPPSVPGMDSGTERRLVPIQCGGPVENPDPDVRGSMSSPVERGACLRWLIRGGVDYRREGCRVPASAREAAAEVGRASPVGEFTAEWMARRGGGPDGAAPSQTVYQAWCEFMHGRGQPPGGINKTIKRLQAAGWMRARIGSTGARAIVPPVTDTTDATDTTPNPPAYAREGTTPIRGRVGNASVASVVSVGEFPPGGQSAVPSDQGAGGGGEGAEVPPAPPGDQGPGEEGDTMKKPKGRYLGILPPDPMWAGETCQRCQGTKLTATGAACLDCEPLHVYVDRYRPLPADKLERARRFLADRQADRPAPSDEGRRLLARLGVDATVH